ncbi:BTAD domain-containing putative transcriptional regulator [Actinocorallia herbida]|uniref:BTAD domain-containing putative transcriptional regulator n=1 Tax=Actinocorallia herbida TaxID=58109 RepID=UPI00147739C5|nr:BTAD domain-containing putative transcriptional regulator [Actinocorallia herbida]
MEFRVLGPLEITHKGRSVAPTAAKDRAFLGELLAHPGRPISTGHLADHLWPGRPPSDPVNAVQVRASRLRTLLRSISDAETARRVLRTRSGGYEFDLCHATSDLVRFEAAAFGGTTREALRSGLALWRGLPFGDVPRTPCVEMQVARIEELRLSVLEAYADRCLEEHDVPASLVAELAGQAARNPLREPLHQRLINVLHLAGRSAEALTCYERLRTTLADELGTDPQPELRRLHREILAGPAWEEVSLTAAGTAASPAAPETPRPRFGRLDAAVLTCLAAFLLAGIGWFSTRGPESPAPGARPVPGDRSRFDADVTMPGGTSVRVGERFVKTWRLTNVGTVAWRDRFLARQESAEASGGCPSELTTRVPDTGPGQTVDVSVAVTASDTPGRCEVQWRMVDANGYLYLPQQNGVFLDVHVIP